MGGPQKLALRLTGRIGSGPNGTPATCRQPGGADQRPVCLVLVSLDELAIADPVSGTVLAAWPTGSLRDANDARWRHPEQTQHEPAQTGMVWWP